MLWVPVCLAVSLFLFSFVGDDTIFFEMPSFAIGLSATLLVFNLTLPGSALLGFRRDKETAALRARTWNLARTGKRLIAASIMTLLAIILFDLQLQYQLRQLKATTLKEWESQPAQEVADVDNAALVFLELLEHEELLDRWKPVIEDLSLRDFDSDDERLAELDTCKPVFEILRRAAAKPLYRFPGDKGLPTLLEDDKPSRLFVSAVGLFALHTVQQADQGDVDAAWKDLLALRNAAKHQASDPSLTQLMRGAGAWSISNKVCERILRSKNTISNNDLRRLIDEQHNPRLALPNAFASAETAFTLQLCNTYLGTLSDEELDDLNLQHISDLPPIVRFLAHIPDRLMKARDDLIALKARNDVFDSYASRLNDPTATTDDLIHQYRLQLFPVGTMQSGDMRSDAFITIVGISDIQKLSNIMVAATLYERDHGTYPDGTSGLVSTYLTTEPHSLSDGVPYEITSLNGGIVIYRADDAREIEAQLASFGTIEKATAERRYWTFLGPAHTSVFSTNREAEESDGQDWLAEIRELLQDD
jgi:hypothetical protein